jgi:hypothetical protein
MTRTAKTTGRGGYRGGTAVARYTAQLVALVTPETRDQVLAMASGYDVSQAEIMREVVSHGIAPARRALARRWGPLPG